MYKKFFLIFFLTPFFVFADVNFSEIMSDPEGSDTDREWVEIKSDSDYYTNIENFKFCDSGSCHNLYDDYGTGFKMMENSYAIIAKNPEVFKTEYPEFNGLIFRASFSLRNNPGELLELKDNNGNVIALVEYNPESGGVDGYTSSLFDDIWKNGQATPGAENIFVDMSETETEEDEEEKDNDKEDTSPSQDIEGTYVEITNEGDYDVDDDMIYGKKKIKAEIINNIPTLIAGASSEFNSRSYGMTGVEIRGSEYYWNFGDGEKAEGKDAYHIFAFPGEYVVTLVTKVSSFSGRTKKIVKVIEPNVRISEVSSDKNWIKIKNDYSDILKLDDWFIMVDGEKFQIPKETYILANGEIIFPNTVTHFDVREDSKIFLLFPNEQKQSRYIFEETTAMSLPKTESVKIIATSSPKIEVKNSVSKEIYSEETTDNLENQNDDFVFSGNHRNLILNKEENYIQENIHFILFVIFTAFLVVVSFLLNYFKDGEMKNNTISREAKEYFIEEE